MNLSGQGAIAAKSKLRLHYAWHARRLAQRVINIKKYTFKVKLEIEFVGKRRNVIFHPFVEKIRRKSFFSFQTPLVFLQKWVINQQDNKIL